MTDLEAAAGLERAILRAEEWAGTPPAKEAVKLRPSDWHAVCDLGRKAAAELKAAEARALKAEKERDEARQKCALAHAASERYWALVAEAVRVCEPFAKRAGKLDGHWLDHETHWSPAYGSTEITIRDLRAARAFIDRAKESNHAV